MKISDKLMKIAGILVIAAMGVAACTPAAPATPKSVTGGWTQEPDNIVPGFTQMSYAYWIAQLTLVGLGEWDENGNLVPELAKEVPSAENGGISADGLTVTW